MYRLLILSVVFLLLSGCNYHHDRFTNDGYLASGYNWYDEVANDLYEIKDGYLKITAKRCQDLWGGFPVKRGAPVMWRDAPSGDYDVDSYFIATRYPSGPQQHNSQVGFFIFQGLEGSPYVDEDNWLFFGLTNHDFEIDGNQIQGDGLIVTKTINDASSIVAQEEWDSDSTSLRIEKRGNTWEFYSSSGLVGSVTANFENDKVGMGVKTLDVLPGGAGCPGPITGIGKFDYFRVQSM